MGYLTPDLTTAGLGMLLDALNGDSIIFTKLVIGNGTPSDPESTTDVVNPVITINLTDIQVKESYVILTGRFTNSSLAAGFYMRELGVYAKNNADTEALYAYRYAVDEADYIPANDSGRMIETTISVIVSVGQVDNISAILIESDAYASAEAFNDHITDYDNPHHVTKQQVGLGNVPNLSPADMTVEFDEAKAYSKIASGEKLSTLFGKLARLFTSFKTHIDAKNPHGTTADIIGAAAKSHTHSTNDINSGVLSPARGGTGVDTIAKLAETLKGYLAAKVHTHAASDVTSGTLPVERGGTGVNTAAGIKSLVQSNHGIRCILATDSLGAQYWSNGKYDMDAHLARKNIPDILGSYFYIDVYLRPDATEAQQKAFYAARMTTDPSSVNVIVATGTVPTVDIPVMVVTKEGF